MACALWCTERHLFASAWLEDEDERSSCMNIDLVLVVLVIALVAFIAGMIVGSKLVRLVIMRH